MQKMTSDGKIYRLPPTKEHPKGLRVRKSIEPRDWVMGQLVAKVSDGRMWYTKEKLTESK